MTTICDKPTRVRLQRTKGWCMPSHTKKVDRSTKFGNPFKASPQRGETNQQIVDMFQRWITGDSYVLAKYPDLEERRQTLLRYLPQLRGWNLACWCADNDACHADVLLTMANQE